MSAGPININFGGGKKFDGARLLVDRVNGLVSSLATRWTINLALPGGPRQAPRTLHPRPCAAPKQGTVAEVAAYLTGGTSRMPARDFFEVNSYAQQVIGQAVVDRFVADVIAGKAPPNAGALMVSMAYQYRALVIRRFESGGGDLRLAPLAAATVRRKIALGYPTRIGTMTGQTLAALRKAQPVARKL